jgi:hypothetical protein
MKLLTGSITVIVLVAGGATAAVVRVGEFYQETKEVYCDNYDCHINFAAPAGKKGMIVRRAACEDINEENANEVFAQVALETLDASGQVQVRTPIQTYQRSGFRSATEGVRPAETLHLVGPAQKLRVNAYAKYGGYPLSCTIVAEIL